jgi:hypothetical protein
MDLQHVNIKLFVDGSEASLEPLVPIFHRWIQEKALEELLLDVADYRHVHAGPGVMLIGHQANYSIDNTDDKLGLLYNRKTVFEGTNQDRFRQAARAALTAYQRLVAEPKLEGKIQFNSKEIQLLINDRFLGPNTAETRAEFEPEVKSFCSELLGSGDYTLCFEKDPRKRLSVTIRSSQPISSEQLLSNLAAR